MRILWTATLLIGLSVAAEAGPHYVDANGNKIFTRSVPNDIGEGRATIRSKYGATAIVSVKHAERFQGYISELEEHYGAKILDMGGIRKGRCRPGGMHPCGRAIDLCQLRRGVVDSKCNLPAKADLARIAREHGLFEGGLWCDSDYGHAQVGISAPACSGESVLVARAKHRGTRYAKRHHHHRYASRYSKRHHRYASR